MRITARNADRHALYEVAVQQPSVMVGFIQEVFAEYVGRPPQILREDFCGTARLSAKWVESDPDRRAIAVDLDPKVIAWAEKHNRAPLGKHARRLRLIESDVLACNAKADAVVSLNFSHFIYKTRDAIIEYLRHVRRSLKPGGVFICDTYGGPGALHPCSDERKFGTFTYIWQQESFDPVTHRVVNRIHFKFPRAGGKLTNAFTYDWRLWSIAELRECLADAGLTEIGVCFESEHGFTDTINPAEHDAWVAYLIAQKA